MASEPGLSFQSDRYSIRPVFLLALVLAATFVVYSGSLGFQFVWDDETQIAANPMIREARYLPAYFQYHVWSYMAPVDLGNYYRPLFLVWLLLNYKLFGANTMGWHLTTVLAHLGATAMVYLVARRLTRNQNVGLLAALIFGLHPVHIEAVSWVSGVTEPLLAIPFMAALLCHLRARETKSVAWRAASLSLFVISMLLKETALVFPAFVFAYEWLYPSPENPALENKPKSTGSLWRRTRSAILITIPYALLIALYIPLRIHVLRGFSHPVMSIPLLVDLLTIPSLLWFYAKLLLYPVGLSVFYDTPYVVQFGVGSVLMPAIVVAAMAGALWFWWRRTHSTAVLYSAVFLIVPLLPLFNLSTFQNGEIAHDRYLYLPSVGFSILAAMALLAIGQEGSKLGKVAATRVVAIAAVALFLAGATVVQNAYWADNLVLYFRGMQIAPNNNLARVNLANELLNRGMSQQAIGLYQQVLERDPNYWLCIYNLGYVHFRLGHYEQAESFLTRAALMNPRDADSALYLGLTKRKLGKLDDALIALKAALQREPRGRGYRYSLGLVLEEQGKPKEALEMFEAELQHNPRYPEPKVRIAKLQKELHVSPQ